MGQSDPPDQVAFSWVELVTSDLATAKAFYETVFGWTAIDSDTSEGTYVLFQQDHADVAGLFEMGAEQRETNTPPHWLPFISVPSVNEAASRAGDLGASLINPPTDLGSSGRTCVIEDPTGAVLAFWEARDHPGTGLVGEPVSVTWAEHISPKPDEALSFYTELLGWAAEHKDATDRLHSCLQGEVGDVAGVLDAGGDDVQARWRVYFSVVEAEQTLDQIERNGGAVQAELDEEKGLAIHATDPEGATFGFLQREEKRKTAVEQ